MNALFRTLPKRLLLFGKLELMPFKTGINATKGQAVHNLITGCNYAGGVNYCCCSLGYAIPLYTGWLVVLCKGKFH